MPKNGFYCTEIAYWSWQQIMGNNFGIPIEDVMYPDRGVNNSNINSLLAAYLCEKSMKVKELKE